MIGKLYHIEAMARKKAPPDGLTEIERIYQWRQEKSRPILDALHAWLVRNQKEVMPQSLIGKAISYAIGQWIYIYRYIDRRLRHRQQHHRTGNPPLRNGQEGMAFFPMCGVRATRGSTR